VIDVTDLEDLVANSRALFVVDEAYFDFHGETALELASTYRNVVILRTFSKAFATAGLRFGSMVGHEQALPLFAPAKLPYNVSIFTMAAVEVALEHDVALKGRLDELKRERDRVIRELGKLPGVRAFSSRANFVLFETSRKPRALWDALVRRGVLVRDVSKYPKLAKALRVSIGRPEENDSFLRALDSSLAE
jgi:histidinol-phosphate/aromatic aminotransferase/cobyric acid decarboxylase-like protein